MNPTNKIAALLFAATALTLASSPAPAVPQVGQSAAAPTAHATPPESDPFALPSRSAALPLHLAHAILVKASPDKESVVSDVPDEVLLIFNDAVGEEYLALAVVDEAGKRVDKHDAKLDFTDRSHLRASVESCRRGGTWCATVCCPQTGMW